MNSLQELQKMMAQVVGPDFVEASDHDYHCTCDKCREWWLSMGPEDGSFGPFGDDLWEPYAEQYEVSVEDAKAMCEEIPQCPSRR